MVVLGGRRITFPDHLRRFADHGFLCRLDILLYLSRRTRDWLGVLLGRVGDLGDLEPYARGSRGPEEVRNLTEPRQRRERSEFDSPTLSSEPPRVGDVPQDLIGDLRIGCPPHGVLTLRSSRP